MTTASIPARSHVVLYENTTQPRTSFTGVARSEWIKLSSLRSIHWTVTVAVAVGLGLSALAAFGMSTVFSPADQGGTLSTHDYAQYVTGVTSVPVLFLALIFGMLGVFAVSSEYSSGMILSTLTATPRRGTVFGAKLLVVACASAAVATAVMLASALLAGVFQPAAFTALGSTTVVTALFGSVLFLVLNTLFAFGIAALLRSTTGAITALSGVLFVLPIALNFVGITGWRWVEEVALRVPLMLSNTLSLGVHSASEYGSTTVGLSYTQAALWMMAWALATLLPAAILFKRRDAH